MQYRSPIYLIADKSLGSVDPATLKRWRKELMLSFSFGSQSVVEINGREYDKQTVTELFEDLQENFELHRQIWQNKSLLNFLEAGNIDFFSDRGAQIAWKEVEHNEQFISYFDYRYALELEKAVENPGRENLYKLRMLRNSSIQIPPERETAVYAGAFGVIERFTENFGEVSANSFPEGQPYRLRPEISTYINDGVNSMLSLLPDSFADLRRKFAIHIHNNLIFQAFGKGKGKKAQLYNLHNLKLLLLAAKMDRKWLEMPETDTIIQGLERLIDSKTQGGQSSTGSRKYQRSGREKSTSSVVWTVVVAIILLVRIAIAAEKCNRNKRSTYRYQPSTAYEYKPPAAAKEYTYTPPASGGNSSKTFGNYSSTKNDRPTEAYAPTKSVEEVTRQFNPGDLMGVWESSRTKEGSNSVVNYRYYIKNYSGGKRVIAYTNPNDSVTYSVSQNFTFSVNAENYYSGKINFKFKEIAYTDCTAKQGQKLLKLAAHLKERDENWYSKDVSLDFSIPGNRNNGLSLGQETFKLSIGEANMDFYRKGKLRKKLVVQYVNKLLEVQGVSIGPSNRPLRFYADKSGKYLVGKSGKHRDTIAEIRIPANNQIYFKPLAIETGEKTFACFQLNQVNYIDRRGRYSKGEMQINFHRKKGFSMKGVR